MSCAPTADFPPELHGLLQPEAYPHAVTGLRLIQTHVSWILLTGPYAYKLKRPVAYPFLDLRSPGMREFCCREELRLNGRFSSGLYCSVVPIALSGHRLHVGGTGRVVEYAVQMVQFEPEDGLDRLLVHGGVATGELENFGRSLSAIHSTMPRVEAERPWGTARAIGEQVLTNAADTLALIPAGEQHDSVAAILANLRSRLRGAEGALLDRRANGAVRECHGDLHARNVVRWRGSLVAFDCLEFEPAFRWIDVAQEIAFLDVDLRARGYALWAHALLQGWLGECADYAACGVLDLYRAHCALVRAKVSLLNPADLGLVARYIEAAAVSLKPHPAKLILLCGFSGSGKTRLARELAPLIDAIHLRSDVERKRIAGLKELALTHSGLARDLYSEEKTEAVYANLREFASSVLTGGQSAVIDASFIRRSQRAEFTQLALRLVKQVVVVHCMAPVAVLRKRIAERQRSSDDASEADTQVLAWQQEHFEPPTVDEARLIEVSTVEPTADLARRIATQLQA